MTTTEDTTTDDTGTGSGDRRRLLAWTAAVALAVAAAIAITVSVVVSTTRPETVPVVATTAEESLPSLFKVAPLDADGTAAILLEYTTSLEDDSVVRYYLNADGLENAPPSTYPEYVVLYLASDSDVPVESIPTRRRTARTLRGRRRVLLAEEDEDDNDDDDDDAAAPIRIGHLDFLEFPHRLPDDFAPERYRGALLVELDPIRPETISAVVSRASFAAVTPPGDAMAEPAMPDENTKEKDSTMESPSAAEHGGDGTVSTVGEPVFLPTQPLVLESDLEGRYNLDRVSITIDTVMNFRNGRVVDAGRIVFDVPQLADAPGPYLYLSKRPFLETKRGDLDLDTDLYVPIEGGTDGQFNVVGRFEQFLDLPVKDLAGYEGGSWIVWCRPFGVWLGGGSIASA